MPVTFPRRNVTSTRLTSNGNLPASYDADTRTVEVVISTGSPVKRDYGIEVLKISKDAVDLSRLSAGGIPVLDSHSQTSVLTSLGRVQDAWIRDGQLLGRLAFHDTELGRQAEAMVARGELSSISAGYQVRAWEVRDGDGNVIDPDELRVWADDYEFTAVDWALLECSLVSVPADSAAGVRSAVRDFAYPLVPDTYERILLRMQTRQRMLDRMTRYDDRQRLRDRMYTRQQRQIEIGSGTGELWHQRALRSGWL